jgi:hypothetical protein
MAARNALLLDALFTEAVRRLFCAAHYGVEMGFASLRLRDVANCAEYKKGPRISFHSTVLSYPVLYHRPKSHVWTHLTRRQLTTSERRCGRVLEGGATDYLARDHRSGGGNQRNWTGRPTV